MRKNRSSLTAVGIAIVRAVESEGPADKRICYDPYARRFVPAWIYHIFGFFIKTGYAEWRGPGVNGFLVAPDRYIDDVLQGFLNEGLQQLIILGAGFDSRRYRFDLAGRVNIFEVDHPAARSEKLAILRDIFGRAPSHVVYVPIGFNTQTLQECLLAEGYGPGLKTIFIRRGVSMYLAGEAVDATLYFAAHLAGQGSAIVFDHLYREVLEGVRKQNEVGNGKRYRFMTGEGLTFGIPEDTVEAFLKARGFRHVRDVNAADLKSAYFTGKNAARGVAGGYGNVIGKT